MHPMYEIAHARAEHVAGLNAIELAAARLLTGYAPASVLVETTREIDFLDAVRDGLLWVALAGGDPVGFAQVKLLEAGRAHLDELDVHPMHGRRGLGRRLVRSVCDWAASIELEAVTLSTFTAPPWNAPFYASMGFRPLVASELSGALQAIVADEARRGLDIGMRVVMYRPTRSDADAHGAITPQR